MKKIELDIQMFANNDNEENAIYGVDKNYNKVRVYSKEEADEKKQNKILSGTSIPSNDLGENGDIYLQYD